MATLLGLVGVANVEGNAVHVQVVGETDAGRLLVQRVGRQEPVTVIERVAFVAELALAPEPLSNEVRSAALDLSQAIERAKAMAGTDHLLDQEDFQILHDELEETDQYPFAAALIEHGVHVRTGAVDVMTDPHGEVDGLANHPEPWSSPGGAGEVRGVGEDPPDAPGSFPWSPADSGDGISNESATSEHDFPWPRKVEGQGFVPDPGGATARCSTCKQSVPYGERHDKCPSCGGPLRYPHRTSEGDLIYVSIPEDDEDGEHEAEMGWSGTELVDERWARRAQAGDDIDEVRSAGTFTAGRPVYLNKEQRAFLRALRDGTPGELVPDRPGEDLDDWDNRANIAWEDVIAPLLEHGFIERSGDSFVLTDTGRERMRSFRSSRSAGIVASVSMMDIAKHPLGRPKHDLEKDSDANTPSGRDRGLNPSVHEEIGEAYQSNNQFEDPDLHLGWFENYPSDPAAGRSRPVHFWDFDKEFGDDSRRILCDPNLDFTRVERSQHKDGVTCRKCRRLLGLPAYTGRSMRDLVAMEGQPYQTGSPVAEGEGEGVFDEVDLDESTIQPHASRTAQAGDWRMFKFKDEAEAALREWAQAAGEGMGKPKGLRLTKKEPEWLPTGNVIRHFSTAAGPVVLVEREYDCLVSVPGHGSALGGERLDEPFDLDEFKRQPGRFAQLDDSIGVAGDAYEDPGAGEPLDSHDEDAPPDPKDFGVMASRSMREIAQGIDNRLSDPNVQTDVDEQMGDRAIARPPEDEAVRYDRAPGPAR
jgi:hypothetical protein